jgi:hypothetical protein
VASAHRLRAVRDWPGIILRLAAAREWDGRLCSRVFVLGGPHESRVTVVAQQTRAVNLAWALHRTGRLTPACRIGVVGAGAAGATFAAAASLLGARVTLFDEHEEPITTQRWSFDRYLHPNLFDWPVEGWDEKDAGLPVVNWSAGRSAMVRLHMLAGFALAAAEGGLTWCSQHSVSEVRPAGEEVELTVCDLRSAADAAQVATVPFDLAVVATGFLPEPWVARTAVSGSYWKDNPLGQALGSATADLTIVGDGDGALTELLRLCLDGGERPVFHQATLAALAERLLKVGGLGQDVLGVEAGISGGRGQGTLQTYAGKRFDKADGVLDQLVLRDARRVEVRAGRVSALRSSFALNRLLAARLTKLAGVRFVHGEPFAMEDVGSLAPSEVIWRTGPRQRRRTQLIRPALGPADAGEALADDPARQDVLGIVDDLMDASREPRWDERADAALAGRSSEPALTAAATLERAGLEASRKLSHKPAVWPAFVDEAPLLDLAGVVLDLAAMASSLGRPGAREVWSNFQVSDEAVDLSLDLVAVAADLTPTEVVHRLRRPGPAEGIGLVVTRVRRGLEHLERVWVRVDRARLDEHEATPDWTMSSLLVAPGFAKGDCLVDGDTVELAPHTVPETADEPLRLLVEQVLAERGLEVMRPIRGRRDGEPVDEPSMLAAAADGDPRLERAWVNVLHRRLGGDDDALRAALAQLAYLAAKVTGGLIAEYLTKVLGLAEGDDRAATLMRAAHGPLTRRDPATGALVAVAPASEPLSNVLPGDEPVAAEPPLGDLTAPDLSAFAVYIPPTDEERR